jgi:hypothetical protein
VPTLSRMQCQKKRILAHLEPQRCLLSSTVQKRGKRCMWLMWVIAERFCAHLWTIKGTSLKAFHHDVSSLSCYVLYRNPVGTHSGFFAHRLSYDHTADDVAEQERVKECGGFITRGRWVCTSAIDDHCCCIFYPTQYT